jgi:hypothetical protein
MSKQTVFGSDVAHALFGDEDRVGFGKTGLETEAQEVLSRTKDQ